MLRISQSKKILWTLISSGEEIVEAVNNLALIRQWGMLAVTIQCVLQFTSYFAYPLGQRSSIQDKSTATHKETVQIAEKIVCQPLGCQMETLTTL
jgi:hypothetical protein